MWKIIIKNQQQRQLINVNVVVYTFAHLKINEYVCKYVCFTILLAGYYNVLTKL